MAGKLSQRDFSVGIIGAGISGITIAIRLKEIGFENFTLYERDVDVGGTWLTNTYPGCRCDVGAHLYSLSTHPNPNWSESHPPQTEILEYWKDIARKEGVYPHCEFLISFVHANWDEAASLWNITLRPTSADSTFGSYTSKLAGVKREGDGGTFEKKHNVLISGTGGFSWPLIPKIQGLPNPYPNDGQPESIFNVQEGTQAMKDNGIIQEKGENIVQNPSNVDRNVEQFEGTVVHPSRWPRDGLDLRGKRVAVLGNGCSATQIIPNISSDPEVQVLNFVRSGQYFLPRKMTTYPLLLRKLFAYLPGIMLLYRWIIYLRQDFVFLAFQLQHTWFRGLIEKLSRSHIRGSAPSKEVAETLVPDFPFGGKRTVFDVGYIESLSRPNVRAIVSPIRKFTKHGIVTGDGEEHLVDVVVIATGYDVTASVLTVEGRHGVPISDSLTKIDGPQAYKTMMYPGFPNMYSMLGANVAPAHTSVIINIEVQANWIAQVIKAQLRDGIKIMEPKEEPSKRYRQWLDNRLEQTTWTQSSSFYRLGKDRKGRVFTNWPAFTTLFCIQNRKPIWKDLIGGEAMVIREKAAFQKKARMVIVTLLVVIVWSFVNKRR